MDKKRSGFVLAEAAVACFVSGVFIAAAASILFTSSALVRSYNEKLEFERLKREASIAGAAGEDVFSRRQEL